MSHPPPPDLLPDSPTFSKRSFRSPMSRPSFPVTNSTPSASKSAFVRVMGGAATPPPRPATKDTLVPLMPSHVPARARARHSIPFQTQTQPPQMPFPTCALVEDGGILDMLVPQIIWDPGVSVLMSWSSPLGRRRTWSAHQRLRGFELRTVSLRCAGQVSGMAC